MLQPETEGTRASRSPWPDTALLRRSRKDPRTGRLVTSLQIHGVRLRTTGEVCSLGAGADAPWIQPALNALALAEEAASAGRIDDSWDLLHSSERSMLFGFALDELKLTATAVLHESKSKLSGWRLNQSLEALATTGLVDLTDFPGAPASIVEMAATADTARQGVAEAMRMLHAHSQNTYLRMQLLAKRLVIVAIALLTVMFGLLLLTLLAPPREPAVLSSPSRYLLVVALGALGALISFAFGSMRRSANFRIYELASGSSATLATRVLVGATSAVVVVIGVEAEVLGADLPQAWTIPAAVAAGFSERLVRRIVESVSASAEGDQGTRSPDAV